MEENKDLMVQEENTEVTDLGNVYEWDDTTEETEQAKGFGITALAIAGIVGAGIALGVKKGYTWLKNRKKPKNTVEVINVSDIQANESDDSEEDLNETE